MRKHVLYISENYEDLRLIEDLLEKVKERHQVDYQIGHSVMGKSKRPDINEL